MAKSQMVQRINELLEEKGIQKAEFYRECGLTSSAFSQWNTGRVAPRMSSVQRVAEYLGTTAEYLYFGKTGSYVPEVSEGNEDKKEEPAHVDDADRLAEFIRLYSRATPEVQDAVLVLLKK